MPADKHWLEQRLPDLFPKSDGKPSTNGTAPELQATINDVDRYVAGTLTGVIHDIQHATEGNRNDLLNKAAYRLGQCIGANRLDETTARAQLEHAGRVCGLLDSEIHKTIDSGLEAGKRKPLEVTAISPNPTDVAEPDNQATTELPQRAPWSEILSDDPPETDWLVDGIIERTRLHALFAPSKTHKSLIVQYLSAQLAQDSVVMYIDLENSRADLRRRFYDMDHTEASLENLHYYPVWTVAKLPALDTPAGGVILARMAEEVRPELIILDTTSRIVKGGENDSDTFRALYRNSLQPIKAMEIAVLRIDHSGKDLALGQRGSSAKTDDVDTVWLLIKQDDDRFTLRCTHQRSGNHPDVINLQKMLNPLRFVRLDEPVSQGATLGIDRVIVELDKLGAPSDMGWHSAYGLLKKAGKHVTQASVQEAVKIRKLELDASSLSGSDVRFGRLAARLAEKSHDQMQPVSEPVSSQCEVPVSADETPVSSSQPATNLANRGIREGRLVSKGVPKGTPLTDLPESQPPEDQLLALFTRHGMTISVVECQVKASADCTVGSDLIVGGSRSICRHCACDDARARGVRCCKGVTASIRRSCMACSLFGSAVGQ